MAHKMSGGKEPGSSYKNNQIGSAFQKKGLVNGGPGGPIAPNTFAKDSTTAEKFKKLGMTEESIKLKEKILKDYDKQFNKYISGEGPKPAYRPNPYGI